MTGDRSAANRADTPSAPGVDGARSPLHGIRVVDLTHDWAGPHATRVLADFGADVIKIEYVRRIDGMRGAITQDKTYDRHPRWLEINRNKRSVTLDLKSPKGVGAFKQLTRVSDVVVESSRVGVMERLGLGYDVLREVKPDLIMVRMAPFGQTGPESCYAGYGGCLEPLSGIQNLTGYAEDEPPMRIREMDVTNGILGACAIMTSLVHRQRTGEGQLVDLSQLETATTGLIGEHLLEFVMNGTRSPRLGNRHRRWAPQGCYRCKGDDAWVALAVRSNDEWRALCDVIGRPGLATELRVATAAGRMEHHDEVDAAIEVWTREQSRHGAMDALQQRGVPAGAVFDAADICRDPHLAARGFLRRSQDKSEHPFPGLPFRLSDGTADVVRRGPALGEHNVEVLGGLLGWDPDEIEPVREEDVGTAFDMD